jgi:hypothetical protein
MSKRTVVFIMLDAFNIPPTLFLDPAREEEIRNILYHRGINSLVIRNTHSWQKAELFCVKSTGR